jgi:hypothetical protein
MGKKYLEPIHGISLKDYVAITKKMASGIDPQLIYKAMGIDEAIFDEINTLWPQRMAEDTTFEVMTLFSQYFAEETTHPNLENLNADISAEGEDNLKRLKTDRYFYEELCAARNAANNYGLDGAKWILENFGINLADFQTVAMQHWSNKSGNSEEILEFADYRQEKQDEYEAMFAKQQGGNIADDVEF